MILPSDLQQVGYDMFTHDNGAFMFADDATITKCPRCGCWLTPVPHNPDFVARTRGDLSNTYDHRLIASQKFQDFCSQYNYEGLEFLPFLRDPAHFQLNVLNILPVNLEQSKVRRGNQCIECGNFAFVVAEVIVLDCNGPLTDGIFRTDLLFGSNPARFPSLVVGMETYDKMKKQKLKGLVLYDPAYGTGVTQL